MLIGDKIAIGIFILCLILGVFGAFRWLMYLITGAVVGLLILVCIGLLVDNSTFDELSRGVFKQGIVIPYIRSQVKHIQDFFRHTNETSYRQAEVSTDGQEYRVVTACIWTILLDSPYVTTDTSALVTGQVLKATPGPLLS